MSAKSLLCVTPEAGGILFPAVPSGLPLRSRWTFHVRVDLVRRLEGYVAVSVADP